MIIHPGVFVPAPPAAYHVDERGVGLPCGREGEFFHLVKLLKKISKQPSLLTHI